MITFSKNFQAKLAKMDGDTPEEFALSSMLAEEVRRVYLVLFFSSSNPTSHLLSSYCFDLI
jgi:hypothetical protein